eukprot:jgi/Psemu1/1919/gm1.1919_g
MPSDQSYVPLGDWLYTGWHPCLLQHFDENISYSATADITRSLMLMGSPSLDAKNNQNPHIHHWGLLILSAVAGRHGGTMEAQSGREGWDVEEQRFEHPADNRTQTLPQICPGCMKKYHLRISIVDDQSMTTTKWDHLKTLLPSHDQQATDCQGSMVFRTRRISLFLRIKPTYVSQKNRTSLQLKPKKRPPFGWNKAEASQRTKIPTNMAKQTRSQAAAAAAAAVAADIAAAATGVPTEGAGAAQNNALGIAPPVASVGAIVHAPGVIAPAARTVTAAARVGTVPPAIDGAPPVGAVCPVVAGAALPEVAPRLLLLLSLLLLEPPESNRDLTSTSSHELKSSCLLLLKVI